MSRDYLRTGGRGQANGTMRDRSLASVCLFDAERGYGRPTAATPRGRSGYVPPDKAGQEPPKDPVVDGLGLWS